MRTIGLAIMFLGTTIIAATQPALFEKQDWLFASMIICVATIVSAFKE